MAHTGKLCPCSGKQSTRAPGGCLNLVGSFVDSVALAVWGKRLSSRSASSDFGYTTEMLGTTDVHKWMSTCHFWFEDGVGHGKRPECSLRTESDP